MENKKVSEKKDSWLKVRNVPIEQNPKCMSKKESAKALFYYCWN